MKLKSNWRDLLKYKSQLSSIKDIDEKNAVYQSLSKQEQKFEVCLDVIYLLAKKQLYPTTGTYWGRIYKNGIPFFIQDIKDNNKLHHELLNLQNSQCEVCIRGAIMISTIRSGNTFSTQDPDITHGSENNNPFELKELIEMEGVFEKFFGVDCDKYYVQNTYGKGINDINFPYEVGSPEFVANVFLNVLHNGEFDLFNFTDYLVNLLDIE